MKKLLSIILSITLVFTMSTLVLADEVDNTIQVEKITVGINAQFPPFEYYDENGELYGLDIDLMNYIGERIGFEIEYVDMSFDKLIPAVMSGEVACAISAISITEERNNVIDYTIPYLSAKVTHINGETSDTSIEQYAVVFPNNSAEKGKLTEAAGEPETSLYNLVNNALSDLIEDKTIEKLGEKYELNKAADTNDFDYEYTVIPVPDDFDKSNMDKSELSSGGQTSATSIEPSDWASADIEKAKALNITDKNIIYNYTQPITREEFCELAVNMLEIGKSEMDASKPEDFQNVIQDTSNKSVQKLYNAGIVQGKHYTKSGIVFDPDAFITREESATILWRLVSYMNLDKPQSVYDEAIEYYEDKDMISDFAFDAVFYMREMGIMHGTSKTEFSPKEIYTTEQAIATMVRIYDTYRAQPVYNDISEPVFKLTDKDKNIIITEKDILQCNADERTYNGNITECYIEITLSDEARKIVKEATGKIAGYTNGENYIEIIVNEQVVSKPVISSELDGKTIVFTCDYPIKDVIKFANIIKSQLR